MQSHTAQSPPATSAPATSPPASPGLAADRAVVAAALVLTAVLFLPDAADPVNVIKLTALLLCTLAVLFLAAVRVVRSRVLVLPTGLPLAVGLAALLAFVVATVAAPHTPTAVFGTTGRNAGLLAYSSAVVLYLVTLRVFDTGAPRALAFGVVLGGLFTSTYGVFQLAGVDAVGWNNPFNPVIAGLGNPNFAAAYIGISVPCAAWGALWTGWSVPLRVLSGATAVLGVAVAVLSDAVQGPLAAGAGLAVLAVAVLLNVRGRLRVPLLAALGAVTAVGLAVLLLGVRGTGPATVFFSGISYRARTYYWTAAVSMWERAPVFGVGLDSYGIRWRQERPLEVPRTLGGDHYSDAAHNVFLQMLAQGGVLLAATFLALTLLTAVALVRGLLRTDGQQRLLLGGLGGAWAAYQVQALVSIDQVPLLLVNQVLSAGVLVAASAVRLRTVRLPGALPPPDERAAARRRVALVRERELTGADMAVLGVLGLVVLALSWFALRPTLASQDAFEGDVIAGTGDGNAAVQAYDRAIGRASYNAAYHSRKGALYNSAGEARLALEAFRAGVDADPFDIGAVRTAGRLAAAQGSDDEARRLFERAVRLDPTNSATVLDLARFELERSGAQRARDLLEPLVVQLPEDAAAWASLGDARLVTGDRAGAKEAYDRALALQPDEPTAVAGLGKLAASPAA